MDASHVIDNLVREIWSESESVSIRTFRDMLHRCVDESCDQLELDSVDYKLDEAEANSAPA